MSRCNYVIVTLLLLLCMSTYKSFAQTNTFPSSGNVGIGTTSPMGKLDVLVGGWGNIPRIIFSQTSDNPSIRLYRPTGSTQNRQITYPWWIENSKALLFKSGSSAVTGQETVTVKLAIKSNGDVGIGTTNPTAKLAVNGTAKAKEMIVTNNASDWPDYVFDSDFKIPDFPKMEEYIKKYKHLPGFPSKNKIESKGENLGAIQTSLLKQVEELTLQNIYLQKQIKNQKRVNRVVEKRLENIEAQLMGK